MLSMSRTRLETFLLCQRRFELRYLKELPWPIPPTAPEQATARQEGELFHQLIAQHYLALDSGPAEVGELAPPVREWWGNFLRSAPRPAADARLFVEMSLAVPVGNFLLTGRFDLVVVAPERVDIYDWKTGRPRSNKALAEDWQTRLYLALVVEGGEALGLPRLSGDQVQMTYWYARSPADSQKIGYSQLDHRRNLGEINRILDDLDRQLAAGEDWPLTSDLSICARCAYQNYCGRFAAAAVVETLISAEAGEPGEEEPQAHWSDVADMEPGGE